MIHLKQMRLINWYGFSQVTFPIGFFTLIAGKNGNGKSVLLDAMKYALYGDSVFNKSSENTGSRTVVSYTRGLLDATAMTYMRPAEKLPSVYSHIVFEMEEVELGRRFILGTVIDTDSGNGFKTHRYVLEDKTLAEISHTYEENGQIIPYSSTQFQKTLGIKMMDAKEGLAKFMQRTGMRLNEEQLLEFRRKLRSIMSYNPDAKIDQFIRDSVLEEKKVDFSKLVEAKNNIDSLNASFESIGAEIQELDVLLNSFDNLQRVEQAVFADDVKRNHRDFLKWNHTIEDAVRNIEIAVRQIEEDEKKLVVIDDREKTARNAVHEAKLNRDSLDCAKAIVEAEQALEKVEQEKTLLLEEKKKLSDFQAKVSELMAWFHQNGLAFPEPTVLSSLLSDSYTSVQKESSVNDLLSVLRKYRDGFLVSVTKMQDAVKENQKEQAKWEKIKADCEAKKTDFSEISDYVTLKTEINKEFTKRGIQAEAKFACEYVLSLKDESWRNAIESHLGPQRYIVLVEPEYYDIADDVFNRTRNKRAHLLNTKLLVTKKIIPEADSVVQFLEVKNPTAKLFFQYRLGRFHATERDLVRNFENAMSKDGRISSSMDSYFLDFDKIRFYYLGQETIRLNGINAEKRLKALQEEYREQMELLTVARQKKAYLDTTMGFFGVYQYDAYWKYEALLLDVQKKQEEIKALQKAQENNKEYMELVRRVSQLEKELAAVGEERTKVQSEMVTMKSEKVVNENNLNNAKEKVAEVQLKLNELRVTNHVLYEKAVEEYERYLAKGETGAGGIVKDKTRLERDLMEARKNLLEKRLQYDRLRGEADSLSMADTPRAHYEERKSKIYMDDLQMIQKSLKEQTKRYTEIFKNEFVLTVLKACETAKGELSLINAELDHLKFKSKYAFDVKYVKDGSDYEKILEYAKYLKEREKLGTASDQRMLDGTSSYSEDRADELEGEMKKIIGRIVASNEREKIECYADYRNYMTYEILLTNDVLKKAKLSKQSGYNSGAEVQIPYMLILISALLMIYNDKSNSTRLVFIDEPFAKMDPTNVKIMLGFMKEQNLQMIFCAPDKTELIGNACEVVLPVLKTQTDLTEIGIIEIHQGV